MNEPRPPRQTLPRGRRRLGLRREVLILLPVALLLLVVLSTFTLFSYQNALALLAEERRAEAERLAVHAAAALAGGGEVPAGRRLRDLAPGARGIAVLDSAGTPLALAGQLSPDPLAPAGGAVAAPLAAGPSDLLPDSVAGFAPAGEGRTVLVELPAGALGGQMRGFAVLRVVVLAINSALLLLVLFFLRHLLAPYETLLERARQMGEIEGAPEGEVELLLATFDRALAALARPAKAEEEAEDDIAALERTLSASLQSGLLLLDRQGAVLALNPVGAELLATPPPEPGVPLGQALAGQPEVRAILEGAVRDEQSLSRQECAAQTPQGARRLGLTVHPLRRAGGEVRGYLVLFADLTAVHRQAEERRIAESLARLGEMAAGVAHELRNSLATLSGYLTLIERRPDEESAADYLAEMRHETAHLQRVVDDFLAFARPGTARLEELSLAALLRRAAADPALAGTAVEVRAGADVRLRGDRQLLERAVRNLIHNAAQAERAAGRSGPIEVALAVSAEGAEVAVRDRGAGVPPEVRERLFHPFATGRPEGVGLGLALAHRIVDLHGGRLRLEDRPEGGTRALLRFPVDTFVTEGNKEAQTPPSPAQPPDDP